MKNVISRGAAIVAVVTAMVFGAASAAHADEVSDAVATLQSGNSYVAPGIGGATPSDTFAQNGIGVVVMEVNGNSTLTPAQLAQQIQSQVGSQFETVIVVNADASNSQAYGVAPTTSGEVVFPILQSSGARGVDNLNLNAEAITAAVAGTTTSTSVDPAPSGGFGEAGLMIVGGFSILLVLAAGVTIVTLLVRKARSRKVKAVTSKAINSDKLKIQLEKFADIIERYRVLKFNDFASELNGTLTHINELFTRLDRKGSKSQTGVAEVEYTATLERLNGALGEDYYIDIARNPRLWDRPHERLDEVRAAASAVDAQVLENIKQVNSSRDLDFRVALEAILRSVDQPSAQDMIAKPSQR